MAEEYTFLMRSENELPQPLEDAEYRELRLLEEVHNVTDLSQRELSRKLGIALGVTNLLVRRASKQGYIRATKRSWRRWAYDLTPAGMAHKFRLSLSYIDRFMRHYRSVRLQLRQEISSLSLDSHSRVAIVGTTDMSELAYLALRDIGVTGIEIFDHEGVNKTFLGMAVRPLSGMDVNLYTRIILPNSGDESGLKDGLMGFGISEKHVVELLDPSNNRKA